jgi:hypothetical protein
VHSKVRTETKEDTEQVGKYMIRSILSLKRLSLDKALGQVVYQYGKHSSETEAMDYLEFIVRETSHIPDKGQVMVRYYGLCANAQRGKMRKTDPLCPLVIEDEDPFIQSKGWAEMMKKVYEIDPLICPQCGGAMRIFSLYSSKYFVSVTVIIYRNLVGLDPFFYFKYSKNSLYSMHSFSLC